MSETTFNAVLDEFLRSKTISGDPGMMETMTPDQKEIIQAIKRAYKRINYG